jgi:hypothetical protein
MGVPKASPALPTDNAIADDDSKGAGALQLLPCRRQCVVAVGVLQGGGEAAL